MKRLTGYRLTHPRKRGTVRQLLKRFRVSRLVEGQDFLMAYANGGYDGTCSGLCTLNGKYHYYQNAVIIESRVRLFVVLELSSEEIAFELAYHARQADLFQNENKYSYVDGQRQRRPFGKIDNDVRRTFYDLLAQEFPTWRSTWKIQRWKGDQRYQTPYLHRHVVGYFEWGTHR